MKNQEYKNIKSAIENLTKTKKEESTDLSEREYQDIIANYNLSKLSVEDYNDLKWIFTRLKFHFDDVTKWSDDFFSDSGKYYSEILLLLKYGKNIKLSANIPHKGMQTIDISKEHVIFKLRELINDYLYAKLKEEEKLSFLSKEYNYDLIEDDDLKNVISEEEKTEDRRLDSIGRSTYSVRLGEYVQTTYNDYINLFSKLSKCDAYCLIGGFLVWCGHVPSYTWEEWEVLEKKHKKNIVEGWIRALAKHKNKFYVPKVEASEKE